MHGTLCAAIIASMAPGCELVDCLVTRTTGLNPDLLADAIEWASADGKAGVINISVGTARLEAISHIRSACIFARARGAVIIAACANTGTASLPSALEEVIPVGSLDLGGCERWCCSGAGSKRVYAHSGPYRPHGTALSYSRAGITGNSAAAAAVSGHVARMLSSLRVAPKDVYDVLCTRAAALI
jgi:subtilisin family serine protease